MVKRSNFLLNIVVNTGEVVILYSRSVAVLVEINSLFNSAERITIIYTAIDIVICEFYENGKSMDINPIKGGLVTVLKDSYVYDIPEIIHSV